MALEGIGDSLGVLLTQRLQVGNCLIDVLNGQLLGVLAVPQYVQKLINSVLDLSKVFLVRQVRLLIAFLALVTGLLQDLY